MSRTASSAQGIAPFWTRMHCFFGFPFQWGPLLYLILLSVSSLLGLGFGIVPPMVAILVVEIGILLAVSRYGFRIIQQASRGLLHSRDFMPDWQGSNTSLPWKLFGVLLVWGFVAGLLSGLHPALGVGVNLLLSFALPAIVITLVQDESFRASLNPGAWWRVMHGVGWSYVVLVLFVMMLSQGSETALAMVAPLLNPALLLPVANAVVIYFSFVMASLVGYVMYQHHDALGVELQRQPHTAGGAPQSAASARSRETDRHVSEMVTAGELGHALDVAYEAQRVNPDDLQAHARYHQVLGLMSDKNDTLAHHAGRYIPMLLQRDMTSRAVEVFKCCRERQRVVALDNPEHLLALARHLLKQGDAETALAAVKDFEKTYPGHALVPAALEFAVRVLVQGLQRKDQALAVVKALEARYPGSSHTEEARWLTR